MVNYSVFAPVYNEAGNIINLYKEVKKVMEKIGSWEMIFVNDGSTDNSLDEMLSIKDKKVKVVDLKKNYGQAIAMDAGFSACKGDIIISLDADLQNNPQDIPRLLAKMKNEGLDVVAGWRAKRKDPIWMLFVTKVAKFLRGFLASDGVHDSGCTLRVYRKEAVEDIELWGEMHRYIMALLKWKGIKVSELKVNHRRRICGKTKYNWKKSVKGLVDLIYIWFWKKFSGRPLHLFGAVGLFLIGLGILSGFWTFYLKFFNGTSLSDSMWMILSFFLFLIGIQFFFTGITMDLLIRNYYNSSKEARYKVRNEYVGGK
ncbi:MAG: glycosyltransferase family 2 protein [Nanobdellota archaeon]